MIIELNDSHCKNPSVKRITYSIMRDELLVSTTTIGAYYRGTLDGLTSNNSPLTEAEVVRAVGAIKKEKLSLLLEGRL